MVGHGLVRVCARVTMLLTLRAYSLVQDEGHSLRPC